MCVCDQEEEGQVQYRQNNFIKFEFNPEGFLTGWGTGRESPNAKDSWPFVLYATRNKASGYTLLPSGWIDERRLVAAYFQTGVCPCCGWLVLSLVDSRSTATLIVECFRGSSEYRHCTSSVAEWKWVLGMRGCSLLCSYPLVRARQSDRTWWEATGDWPVKWLGRTRRLECRSSGKLLFGCATMGLVVGPYSDLPSLWRERDCCHETLLLARFSRSLTPLLYWMPNRFLHAWCLCLM